MINIPFFAGSALLAVAGLLKVPALIRARRTSQWRLLAAVCALLLAGSLVLLLAAPDNIALFNRWTGVTNFSAPLVYGVLSAFSAVSMVLILVWRDIPPGGSRLTPRRCLVVYTVISAAIVGLFIVGDTPVERLRDFDTYYANTPYIREMIVLYLLAHGFASSVMVVLCQRWAAHVDGLLRLGLRLLVVGYGLDLAYDIAKGLAVAARWAGGNWDDLSTMVAPVFALLSTLMVATGFILPFVGLRLRSSAIAFQQWHRMAPLARLVVTHSDMAKVSRSRIGWAPELRMMQRQAACHDALLELRPFMDPRIREFVREQAADRGPRAELEAMAAMVAVAADTSSLYRTAHEKALTAATARGARSPEEEAKNEGRRAVLDAGRYMSGADDSHPYSSLPDLAELSVALSRSDHVRSARNTLASPRV
ncbi:DUF6545 domain-containing protein [Streptomyces jumonjinensis]|uniref:DUF6545 domain-containing protein n=1 Tax=Streptomyces jumonjinensis TaxID=1945 RepID=A0A646KKY9_STRJU|nr:DUF6545 domain-containing protein [Streptomyces jumonjinensis]MQT01706.1 hypothetical protein [Streptomyces jumonjinensis]